MMILLDLDMADLRLLSDLETARANHIDAPDDETLAAVRRMETRFATCYSALVRHAIPRRDAGIMRAAMQSLSLDELRSLVATREEQGG